MAVLGCALALSLLTGCGSPAGGADAPLLVAAASNLRPVLPDLLADFSARSGRQVTVTYGSSGQLAQQLTEGAPYELFLSADAGFVDRVLVAGVGAPDTRAVFAEGRLVLWTRREAWPGWTGLAAVAADPGRVRVAIANPEHAPYGRAARQALRAAGAWRDLRARIVQGQSVTDAHRLAASGDVDAAVSALPLAVASGDAGRWVLVPAHVHEALPHTLVVTARTPERAAVARELAALLTSPQGRRRLTAAGLPPPGAQLPATGLPGQQPAGVGLRGRQPAGVGLSGSDPLGSGRPG